MNITKSKIPRKEEMLTQQNLLEERGWTKSLIKSFLPTPDLTKPNPFFQSASPVKLYLKQKIEQIESTEDFKDKKKALEKRKQAAIKTAEKKRTELFTYIDKLIIEIPTYEKDQLYRYACEHYKEYHSLRLALRDDYYGLENEATPDSDEDFLKRISLNFLRHSEITLKDSLGNTISNYEDELDKLFGKIGRMEGYISLKRRINKKIFEQYPYLERKENDQ